MPPGADDDPHSAEVAALRAENAKLQAELQQIHDARAAGGKVAKGAATGAAKLLLPALDRYRIVRSFEALTRSVTAYAGPREAWPGSSEVADKASEFALACLRFAIRRRLFMALISVIAFSVTLSQVVLVYQQNRIIDNQNKYLDIQVYDTIASSLTGRDATGRYITSALLAGVDFALLNSMIQSVFATDNFGGSGGSLLLRETAARGHLMAAFGKALDRRAEHGSNRDGVIGRLADVLDRGEWVRAVQRIHDDIQPTFGAMLADAQMRVPRLLQSPADGRLSDRSLREECEHYFTHLNALLRRILAIHVVLQREDRFFEAVAPLFRRVAEIGAHDDLRSPFVTTFRRNVHELIIDVHRKPAFGGPALPPPDGARVRSDLSQGFTTLSAAVGRHEQVEWQNILPDLARP